MSWLIYVEIYLKRWNQLQRSAASSQLRIRQTELGLDVARTQTGFKRESVIQIGVKLYDESSMPACNK